MTATTRFALPNISASQAQKHVTHNEALAALDAIVSATALGTNTVPFGGESDGAAYIVSSPATGVFTGWEDSLAYLLDDVWNRVEPTEGMLVWLSNVQLIYVYHSGVWQVAGAGGGRTLRTEDLTLYVGKNISIQSISIASPAVVGATAHGRSAGDAVVFDVPQKRFGVTISIATPGVVSKVAHGWLAGQPFKFESTGAIPTGAVIGTTYYVLAAGLTADTFRFSATPGGAAINTTGSQSGAHFTRATGALPTGVVEGTTYYVSTTSLLTDSFKLSDTKAHALAGTNLVATSGSVTGSPVYGAYTGSDETGDGSAGSPFLTADQAQVAAMSYDFSGYGLFLQYCNGSHPRVLIVGDSTMPLNCSAVWPLGNHSDPWLVRGVDFFFGEGAKVSGPDGFETGTISVSGYAAVSASESNLSLVAGGLLGGQLTLSGWGGLDLTGATLTIYGNGAYHSFCTDSGKLSYDPYVVDYVNAPGFVSYATAYFGGSVWAFLWKSDATLRGDTLVTGDKHNTSGFGKIETGGDDFVGSTPGDDTGGYFG